MNKKIVRSRRELKKSLLKRAWSGASNYSAAELISKIDDIVKRVKSDMPEEHRKLLMLSISPHESRYIRAFNIAMEMSGEKGGYVDVYALKKDGRSFPPPKYLN